MGVESAFAILSIEPTGPPPRKARQHGRELPEPEHGIAERRFGGSIGYGPRRYDVSADGQRIVYATPEARTEVREAAILLNWERELERQVAGRRPIEAGGP